MNWKMNKSSRPTPAEAEDYSAIGGDYDDDETVTLKGSSTIVVSQAPLVVVMLGTVDRRTAPEIKRARARTVSSCRWYFQRQTGVCIAA
ncbi:hypothetical protein RRF57_003162 [Xylaria bambusicola]|uniref:Uncharacterized protein n=1 Tax=Xylaria bambusicola TaxID=326684 RepID=A0AAN7UG73_9PEZI